MKPCPSSLFLPTSVQAPSVSRLFCDVTYLLSCTRIYQSTLEAKAQLREALAAEQATAAVRTSELARLSEREVRLTLQVEQLTAELAKIKAESSRALKVGGPCGRKGGVCVCVCEGGFLERQVQQVMHV